MPAAAVSAASLPELLRAATTIDRRAPAPVALARKAAGRTATALRELARREPARRPDSQDQALGRLFGSFGREFV